MSLAILLAVPVLWAQQSVTSDSGISPDSRTERLRQRRLQRQKEIEPAKQGIFERYLKRFDQKGTRSFDDTNLWRFYPRIDWIARGSGAAAGLRFWRPEAFGPVDLMGSAFFSWRQYQHYDVQVGLIPNQGKRIPPKSFETEEVEGLGDVEREVFSRFKFYVSARYRDRTDQAYFGLGTRSRQEDRARYRVKDSLGEVVTGVQFSGRIGWTFKLGALHHTLGRGRNGPSLDESFPEGVLLLPGLGEPPNYIRMHNSFVFDFRDDPGRPHQGFLVAFGWEEYNNVNAAGRFSFRRFGLDGRSYLSLRSPQQVIAVRGVFVNSDAKSGNSVPFFLQPSLGGGQSLRGYEAFRFQGDKLMLVQAEYRWEASRLFELALFADAGTVAHQGERISLEKLKSDFGIGFRVKTSRAPIFRVDQAWGNEGPRTQFRLSAVF